LICLNCFLLSYADDVVIVPGTEEALNMSYFCAKLLSDENFSL